MSPEKHFFVIFSVTLLKLLKMKFCYAKLHLYLCLRKHMTQVQQEGLIPLFLIGLACSLNQFETYFAWPQLHSLHLDTGLAQRALGLTLWGCPWLWGAYGL